MGNGISYKNLSTQTKIGPIFNDALEGPQSVTLAKTNDAGNDYDEVPAGTVLSRSWDNKFRPNAFNSVGAVAAAAVLTLNNDKGASETRDLTVGDWVILEGQTFPFQVSAVDTDNDQITLAENVTTTAGDTLTVDPSRSVATLQAAGPVNTFTFTASGEAAKFQVGDVVNIENVTGARNVTAVDTGANTITVDGAAGTTVGGDKIISNARGGYRIMTDSVYTDYGHGVTPENVMAPTRQRGEVFAKRLRGYHTAAETGMVLLTKNNMIPT